VAQLEQKSPNGAGGAENRPWSRKSPVEQKITRGTENRPWSKKLPVEQKITHGAENCPWSSLFKKFHLPGVGLFKGLQAD
jgi:hypothetical protein